MKIRTLIILSVLFFVLGAAGGGAYAFVSGDNVLAPVAGLLPSPKSPEEKMIEDFIDQQEKKQTQDEDKQTQSEDDKQPEQDAPAAKDPKPAESKDQDKDKADIAKEDDGKRLGQPTVSDGKTLRVRETPDTNGEVLIGIPNTEKVEIIAEKNGWYQIITANGTKGWVSAEYMKEI